MGSGAENFFSPLLEFFCIALSLTALRTGRIGYGALLIKAISRDGQESAGLSESGAVGRAPIRAGALPARRRIGEGERLPLDETRFAQTLLRGTWPSPVLNAQQAGDAMGDAEATRLRWDQPMGLVAGGLGVSQSQCFLQDGAGRWRADGGGWFSETTRPARRARPGCSNLDSICLCSEFYGQDSPKVLMNLQGWTAYLGMLIPKHFLSKEDASAWCCCHDPWLSRSLETGSSAVSPPSGSAAVRTGSQPASQPALSLISPAAAAAAAEVRLCKGETTASFPPTAFRPACMGRPSRKPSLASPPRRGLERNSRFDSRLSVPPHS